MPRGKVSLVAAGFLLLSRRMASQTMLSFIDWQLLVLFAGLFIVNRSFLNIYSAGTLPRFLESSHIDLQAPLWIAFIALILSNIGENILR
jgi:Na+/H+ antiporter NhaD/arsenite permease-like protein